MAIVILIALLLLVFGKYISYFHKTKIINSNNIRFKVTNLLIRSKIDDFWSGQVYQQRNKIIDLPQHQRVEYFVAVLYTMTDDLQRSGEATLVYYELVPNQDKPILFTKLNQLENTEYFNKMTATEKDYVIGMKETMYLTTSKK